MSQARYWPKGSEIVYREIWRGKVWTARPVTVIQDTPNLTALYLCSGTQWKICTPPDDSTDLLHCKLTENWRLADTVWSLGDTLFLINPGEAHAVHVMWAEKRIFVGWYINLQEPLRRTRIGFDFMDQDLDIMVKADLSEWVWKDEASFQRHQEEGIFSVEEAREIRAEGERVIGHIRTKVAPFSEDWPNWIPPPEWSIPRLPEDWDKL
ncbi:MAG: DUF402 domain-containing protein [Anaerolineae bacterium]|nr:DUF402 domain-containing protein [Anaerolineae bacterium]